MKQERVDKINYYLDIAGTVAQRSTVFGRSCGFPGENAMNYVAVSMRKQMQSSVHSAVKCWEPICFW